MTRMREILWPALVVCFGLTIGCGKAVQDVGIDGDRQHRIDDLRSMAGVPGLALIVIENGVRTQLDLGVANAATGARLTHNTVFEAASLSKPVFAYLVLRLVDEGIVGLDRPVMDCVPIGLIEGRVLHGSIDAEGLNRDWMSRVTPRMLLSHSSGLVGVSNDRFAFEPGSAFAYSPGGYLFLQYVVEHITSESLESLAVRLVFDPLEMSSSSFVWQEGYELSVAVGHDVLGKTAGVPRKRYLPVAASSLYTTASDYAKFVTAAIEGRGLEDSTWQEMLSTQVEVAKDLSWGLGFGIERTSEGDVFWQWGDFGIFKAFVFAFRGMGNGVVALSNGENGMSIAYEIIEAMSGRTRSPGLEWLGYERFDSRRHQILRSFRAGGAATALVLLRDFAVSYPDEFGEEDIDDLAYEVLGTQEKDAAVEIFHFNVDSHPESVAAMTSLGHAYALTGEDNSAIAEFEKVLELDEGNEVASKWVAHLQFLREIVSDPKGEALALLEKKASTEPELFTDSRLLAFGSALLGAKRLEDASAVLSLCEEAFPDSTTVLATLAQVRYELGDSEEAQFYCGRSLALDPYNMHAEWVKSLIEHP